MKNIYTFVSPLVVFAMVLSCSLVPHDDPGISGAIITKILGTGSFEYTLDTGASPRDVFFVFAASPITGAGGTASVTPLLVDGKELPLPRNVFTQESDLSHDPVQQRNQEFRALLAQNQQSSRSISPISKSVVPTHNYLPGDTNIFNDTYVSDPSATVRSVTPGVAVAVDSTPRNLVVWVSDDQWGGGGAQITQTMVDAMAGMFLKPGLDNDIYDWLTAILGPEWGASTDPDYIGFTGDVHILLTDIQGDASPNGGVVGYFYALNNFKTSIFSESAEKVMFVIDSYMYANPDDSGFSNDDPVSGDLSWSVGDYWPKEVFSTLAHEFQHMIHFYQKVVVQGTNGSPPWIEEMCSQVAEDLLANKLQVQGPRGVAFDEPGPGPMGNIEGRIPYFNAQTWKRLTVRSAFSLPDYSTTYAFGAWAARNYGGAAFLRNVVHNNFTDSRAIEYAVKATGAPIWNMEYLTALWSVAVLSSDRTDMPQGLRLNNTSWFESTPPGSLGGPVYKLGAINHYLYPSVELFEESEGVYKALPPDAALGPRFYGPETAMGATQPGIQAGGGVLYQAKKGMVGKGSFTFSIPTGVMGFVVIR